MWFKGYPPHSGLISLSSLLPVLYSTLSPTALPFLSHCGWWHHPTYHLGPLSRCDFLLRLVCRYQDLGLVILNLTDSFRSYHSTQLELLSRCSSSCLLVTATFFVLSLTNAVLPCYPFRMLLANFFDNATPLYGSFFASSFFSHPTFKVPHGGATFTQNFSLPIYIID